MTPDLYKTLKVRKNATPEAITRAFRKRSMETHPDRGGSAEAFQAVKHAYTVLSDPARRAHYDATGEDGGAEPDNSFACVLTVLSTQLAKVMGEVVGMGRKPEHEDLAKRLRSKVEALLRPARDQVATLQRAKAAFTTMLGRFSVEGEADAENPLDAVIRTHLGQVETQLQASLEDVARYTATLDFLKRVSYRTDTTPGGAPVGLTPGGVWTVLRPGTTAATMG